MLKEHLKGFIVGITVALIFTSTVFASGGVNRMGFNFIGVRKIVLEEQELVFPVGSKPIIYKGNVYVALTPLFEQLGYNVEWKKNRTIHIKLEEDFIRIKTDEEMALLLSKALTAYMADTGDYNLEWLGENLNVDTIIEKLQEVTVGPENNFLYGPYIVPYELEDAYYPKDHNGWQFIIDKTKFKVTVLPGSVNSIEFVE